MCEGLDLVYRLPKLWARVEAGEVRVHLARLVARKTRDLTEEQAAEVDARIAKYADGRLTWTRFQARLDGLVAAADPKATAEAERKAAGQQVATPTRPDPENDHGLRGFYIKAPAATVLVFDAALQRIADILADPPELPDDQTDSETDPDAPRTGPKPVIDWAGLLPQVVINLHTYAAPDPEPGSEGIARVEGCGPVTENWIRDHLAPHANVTVKPVLDIRPDGRPARAGQSRIGNYGPMTTPTTA